MGRTKRKRKTKNPIPKNLSTDPEIITLIKWMHSNGWQNETQLHPAEFSNTGRGLTSKQKFKPNNTIISIPLKLMINYQTLKNHLIFRNLKTNLTIHEALAIFLIYEKSLGFKSEWFPYISTLPKSYINFVFGEILPSQLRDELLEKRTKVMISYENIKRVLVGFDIGDEILEWSYWTVNTRAVYVDPDQIRGLTCDSRDTNIDKYLLDEPNMALVPFLDLFNHSFDTNTSAEIINNTYTLITKSNFDSYDQIFISYGAHDSIKLIVEYGFFISHNKFDTIILSLDQFKNRLSQKQNEYIISNNLSKDAYISRDGSLSFNAQALLYTVTNPNCKAWSHNIYSNEYSSIELKMIYKLASLCCKKILNSYMEMMKMEKTCGLENMLVDYLYEYMEFLKFVINIYDNK